MKLRLSTPADVPALRALWALAFGDSGPYLDNFFDNYYRPHRMIVLEREGEVLSMTAWFDTDFVVPGRGTYRAAYLYAVATHPACRGEGLSGAVLAWADHYFRALGIPVVTTVPAEPSLHRFFGANGFGECFVTAEREVEVASLPAAGEPLLRPVGTEEYGRLREELLSDIPHIAYPADTLTYQAGCCAISGGGLFAADTPAGPVLLCAEGAGDGLVFLKELLGCATAERLILPDLPRLVPARKYCLRTPLTGGEHTDPAKEFGMIKWLAEPPKTLRAGVFFPSSPYLGLAFD